MTRVIKGHQLLREVFQPQQQPNVNMQDVYDSMLIHCEFRDDLLIPKTTKRYEFYVPCSKLTIESEAEDYIEEDTPWSELVKLAKKFGGDVVGFYLKKVKENGRRNQTFNLYFEISNNSLYSLYMDSVKKALDGVSIHGNVGQIWTIEQHGSNEAIACVLENGGDSVLEFLETNVKETEMFKGLAEALDIDGPRLKDPKFLLQIAVYIGAARLLGHNIYDVEEEDVDGIMGEVNDWLEEEFKKKLKQHGPIIKNVVLPARQ